MFLFKILKSFFVLIFFALLSQSAFGQRNVLIIIADDLGSDYCGFYENHLDTVNLPNVRRLLKSGVRFKNAWANPFCSPTRAGILTGRYSFRTGVGAAIGGNTSAVLDTAEITIPKLLNKFKPGGIAKAHIGKWHLQTPMPKTNLIFPNKMGYDHFEGSFPGELTNYFNWTKITNGAESTSTHYATTENADNAISFIKKNKDAPFFVWLAFNAPHTPYHLPPTSLLKNNALSGSSSDISANPKNYFKAMNEAMDHEIGRLFDSLALYNVWSNTDIIFIGDNGDDSPVAQSSPAKGSVYQGGLQVPMIISGPSVKSPNRSSDALVHTTDLFATILELFGHTQWPAQIPISKPVDSKSLLPILKNTSQEVHDWVFAEVFKGPAPDSDGKTIRNKTFKYIQLDNGTKKLFNLSQDPNEKTNLYNANITGINLTNWDYLCGEMSKLIGISNGCSLVLSTENESLKAIPFPNPFNSKINLNDQAIETLYILFAADGKEIYKGHKTKNQDFTFLPTGVYYLQTTKNLASILKIKKE
jgi:arylsulfatase A-like enzyme